MDDSYVYPAITPQDEGIGVQTVQVQRSAENPLLPDSGRTEWVGENDTATEHALEHLQRLLQSHLHLLKFHPRGWCMDTCQEIHIDEINPRDLENILNLQNKMTQYQKDHDFKTLYSVLIIIDDFVDDTR